MDNKEENYEEIMENLIEEEKLFDEDVRNIKDKMAQTLAEIKSLLFETIQK